MRSKHVEVLLQIRETRDSMPEVALLEKLLIEWEAGQWKVTNPDGHSSWIGRHESNHGAILDYLRERLAIPAPDEEALGRIKMLEQALEDIKAIAIQAMTEPTPMPNALTWDCFVRIRNAVEQAQAQS